MNASKVALTDLHLWFTLIDIMWLLCFRHFLQTFPPFPIVLSTRYWKLIILEAFKLNESRMTSWNIWCQMHFVFLFKRYYRVLILVCYIWSSSNRRIFRFDYSGYANCMIFIHFSNDIISFKNAAYLSYTKEILIWL